MKKLLAILSLDFSPESNWERYDNEVVLLENILYKISPEKEVEVFRGNSYRLMAYDGDTLFITLDKSPYDGSTRIRSLINGGIVDGFFIISGKGFACSYKDWTINKLIKI